MGNVISIGTGEVVAIAGILAAYFVGKINGTPKNAWKNGGILDGPSGAQKTWRMPLVIVVLLAVFMILFGRLINSLFSSFRGRSSGGGEYGGGGGYGGEQAY